MHNDHQLFGIGYQWLPEKKIILRPGNTRWVFCLSNILLPFLAKLNSFIFKKNTTSFHQGKLSFFLESNFMLF